VILFLHNRYRTTGGEERVVGDLVTLVREELGEAAELLERDSAALGRARAAAGLLGGGLQPGDVAAAVRRTRARVVHAHNLLPAFGWRALAAAREAGARVVLHLHNYRLVCAVGTCFTRGADCTRCHGRDTRPGVRLNCRGTGAEAAVYAAALALWQRRLVAQADHVIVPSAFAAARLRELGAPLGEAAPLGAAHGHADARSGLGPLGGAQGHAGARFGLGPLGGAQGHAGARSGLGPLGAAVHVVPHPVAPVAHAPCFDPAGPALFAGRLAPEKGADVAIDACRSAGRALVVAGDGPLRAHLEARAAGADVRFLGVVDPARLAQLRAGASVALVPSRSAETFGLAAAEAMAAGLPVLASNIGALPELLDGAQLTPPGDAPALAAALALRDPVDAARRGLDRIRRCAAPDRVAAALRAIYDA